MIVAPNINIRNIIKFVIKVPRDVELTYFRSDRTVGVANDRRVMITVCSPFPPNGSYMWLASYYHSLGLYMTDTVLNLSNKLEKMNAHQTYYQTIGRVKDPTNEVNSIVYSWGMSSATMHTIIQMDKDVPIPQMTYMDFNNSRYKALGDIAKLWTDHHIKVSPIIARISKHLIRAKGKHKTLHMIKRALKLNTSQMSELISTNPLVFEYFGIFQHTNEKNVVFLYA